MQTLLSKLMCQRDGLLLKRSRTKWYNIIERNRLTRLINLYKSDIDKEMDRQLDKELMQ